MTTSYAPSKRHERALIWNSFVKMGKESQLSWLCVGDYSEIGSVWEKQGGAVCSSSRIENFQNVISNCALMDLEFKGNVFTWSNNQVGEANIRERINTAMANVEWRQRFPKAQVFHDIVLGSDHCPLILNLNIPLKKVPKSLSLKECGPLILIANNLSHLLEVS